MLIADDHRLMREGTAALLAADERIEIVGLARDGREAVRLADQHRPDVVVLDLNMPVVGGIEACAAIRERCPKVEVLILTVSEQEPDLYASLRVGAAGYLLKDMAPDQLIEAVLGAGRGEPMIPPSMAGRLLRDLVGEQTTPDPLGDLSDREREVLALLAEGLRNREATVKTHVRHVLEKLRFRNRAVAAAFAARNLE